MAKKQISIKTVDGNRYDFVRDESNWPFVKYSLDQDWIKIEDGSTVRKFFRNNIVSITIKELTDE